MKISIITTFPELYHSFLQTSLLARAQKTELVSFSLIAFSDFCKLNRRIDEPTCGPGPGMILKPDSVARAIEYVENKHGKGLCIFFSPQGQRINQPLLNVLAHQFGFVDEQLQIADTKKNIHLILVCPRYEGIDQRVQDKYAHLVFSIGDYVVMGGDLPAQVFLEGLLRLMPGVVNTFKSVQHDSFMGPFLDYPAYGLPTEWQNDKIPEIVQSGNHAAIEKWRREESIKKTLLKRFDWLRTSPLTVDQHNGVASQIVPHYIALMHTHVKIKGDILGQTSVKSLDIHDIARCAATYGIKKVFIVNPLQDQQKIVAEFLSFWHSQKGKEYNISRYRAVSLIKCVASLQEVNNYIEQHERSQPLYMTTSARVFQHKKKIDYESHDIVWRSKKPILLLFGTGQGLSDELIAKSDFLLTPIEGLSNYNHLSVRSAIAITLDRWLGLFARRNDVLKWRVKSAIEKSEK